MNALIAHVQGHWQGYAAIAVLLLPVVYFTRRYSVPVILWFVEIAIYITALHLFIYGLLRLAAWFKYESAMELPQDKVRENWSVPIYEFWRQDLYNPSWVFGLELFALAVIAFFVFRYRPLRVQAPVAAKPQARKGVGVTKPTSPTGKKG